jgi:hypothetical protein
MTMMAKLMTSFLQARQRQCEQGQMRTRDVGGADKSFGGPFVALFVRSSTFNTTSCSNETNE